jgi:hypothetical protein
MTRLKTEKASPARPGLPKEAAVALAIVEPEIAALSSSALLPIKVDISRAVSIAIGALPHLADLRPRLVAELPQHPIHITDKIGTYALAAWYAHLLTLPSTKAGGTLEVLLAEATPLREDLLVAAEALAHKKLLDPATVVTIRSGQGNLDKANDLVALAALFTQRWSHVHGKTTVALHDVERAAELGPLLLVALGAREQPGMSGSNPKDPAEQRVRAYTLFVNAYEEARRAVSYLRWHEEDVDDIVPSLFGGRKSARKAKEVEPPASEPPAEDGAAASELV